VDHDTRHHAVALNQTRFEVKPDSLRRFIQSAAIFTCSDRIKVLNAPVGPACRAFLNLLRAILPLV
jgi:hypothetical protein